MKQARNPICGVHLSLDYDVDEKCVLMCNCLITGDGHGEIELDRSLIGSLSMEHIRPCIPSLNRFGIPGLWICGAVVPENAPGFGVTVDVSFFDGPNV